jgi:hypothetical protein
MIHSLLVLALILIVIYFLFGTAGGALMNLIWIAVIVLAVLWLLGFMRGRRRTY